MIVAATLGDVILGVVIYLPAWTFFYRLEPGVILEFAVLLVPFYTVTVLRQASTIAPALDAGGGRNLGQTTRIADVVAFLELEC
jgi:hypothetical protein